MAAAHPICRSPRGYLVLFEASNAAGSMAETVQAHCLDQPRLSAERLTPDGTAGLRPALDAVWA